MDKAKLEEFNHWWMNGTVDPELALPFQRNIFPEIERHLDKKFIIALTGLRRVGKTTIIYQLIHKLLHEKTLKTNILFFSFDDVSARLEEVLDLYKEFHSKDFRQEMVY